MKVSQLAAQLYTVREHCQTPAGVAAALGKLRAIGYEAVQVSGICAMPVEELVRILDSEGMTCCATHEPGQAILSEPERVVERLKQLGTAITAYPYPANIDFSTLAGVQDLCGRLDAAGRVLHEAGLVLCYHNHSIEFRRLAGRAILEIIYDETDPRHLQAEPDTYWIQHGGGDVVAWCERLTGRLPTAHLKDYGINDENQPTYCEVGNGNLDWRRIIPALEAAGCQWYTVEQDTCPGDPFESLKQSFEYLRENFCQ